MTVQHDEGQKDVQSLAQPDKANGAGTLLEEGERLLEVGRAEEAEVKLRGAVEQEPGSAYIRNKLGVALARQARLGEAQEQFVEALQLDAHFAPAHSNLGNLYKEEGRLDDAIAAYLQALHYDPEYHIAHHNLGAAYKEQGRIGDAVSHLKRANRLEKEALRREARTRAGRSSWTGPLFWIAIGALVLFLLFGR